MSRTATLAGYLVVAVALAVAAASRRIPSIGQAASWALRWPPVRYAVCAVWLWLGWHLFVR